MFLMEITEIKKKLYILAKKETALSMQRFFAQEHLVRDQFIGIKVPQLRSFAKKHKTLPLKICIELIQSSIHEERLLALLLLVQKYNKASPEEQKEIAQIYLNNTAYINQWNLIDLSAEFILGPYLEKKDRKILYQLAKSPHWWERRIAVITTFHFIRKNAFHETFHLAKLLLKDTHDLVQKAVGWMLKEISKRDLESAVAFLQEYSSKMPRGMLRYALEKFPEIERKHFLTSIRKKSFKK